ncbi:MAG: hypothetical protein ABIK09_05930 [Pseudomonadota bacterium]
MRQMHDGDELRIPEEMAAMLTRYAELLDLEARIRDEKAGLRELIDRAMADRGLERFQTRVGDQGFKVSRREKVEVTYDEALLASRLGDRYRSILAVDTKKVRKHLAKVESLLEPRLDLVGTPSRDKVREAIASGALEVGDFAGTFEKTVTPMVYISRFKDRDSSS